MRNTFDPSTTTYLLERIEQLEANTLPTWGKMTVGQMLAHCNVTYEMAYEDTHDKPNFLVKLLLKFFVKNAVVGEAPYKKNGQTAPAFKMVETKDFTAEKERLITYVKKTEALGSNHFEGKESLSFGKLTSQQWSNMFYKHLDHHLTQFGV